MKINRTHAVLLSGLLLFAAGAYAAGALSPVGWWKFDEPNGVTAFDSSGSGNNGTLYGAAAFMQDAEIGNALQIYGPSGQMAVPHNAAFEPEMGTVSFWVKSARTQQSDLVRKTTDYLVNRGVEDEFYAYGVRLLRDGSLEGVIGNDDLASDKPFTSVRTKSGAAKQGAWTHVAMRWDGTTVALFVNGKLAAASTYTPIVGSGLSYHGATPLQVGALWGDLAFEGSLSDLRIFSAPLSEAEISGLFATKQLASRVKTSRK
jgi:hypothetical protein